MIFFFLKNIDEGNQGYKHRDLGLMTIIETI